MIKKIKEYFELQSLYRKSKKVLIINAASTVTSVKNIVEKVETFINSQENVASGSVAIVSGSDSIVVDGSTANQIAISMVWGEF